MIIESKERRFHGVKKNQGRTNFELQLLRDCAVMIEYDCGGWSV